MKRAGFTRLCTLGLAVPALAMMLLSAQPADARGWGSVHRYVKPSGNCSGQEILASHYASGRRTATGERGSVGRRL